MNSKILVELQYLGCIEYYAKLLQYNEIILERHENFIKSSHRNRCYIAGANGMLRLSIPLLHGRDQKRLYTEIQTDHTQRWRAIHWHSIVSAYKHAPYFEHYATYFAHFYADKNPVALFEWNLQLFQITLQLLKAKPRVLFTESYQKIVPPDIDDYRNHLCNANATMPVYHQVFIDKNGFLPNLSVLDLLMNLGKEARDYLAAVSFQKIH
jgi:hypothetical protein